MSSNDFTDLGFQEHAPSGHHDDFHDLGFQEHAATPAVPATQQPGVLEAAGRGAVQSGTLDFADEIAGAGHAGLQAARKMSLSDVVKDYIAKRDSYRSADKAAHDAHPYAFRTGEFAGALGTALVPGLNIAKGTTIGARALKAAKLGGVMGLGNSSADLTKGEVGRAALDTGIGSVVGGVLQPVGEKVFPAIGNRIGKTAAWAGKKALNFGFDVPEHASEAYMANPQKVNEALSLPDMGQKVANTLGEIRSDTGKLNAKAMESLSQERVPKEGFELNRAIEKLRGADKDEEARKLTDKLMSEYQERLGSLTPKANPGYLTEREMHDVKRTLQESTDWKKPLPTKDQAMARSSSQDLNQTLKEENPEYASSMNDLSENINTKNKLAQKFSIKPDYKSESGFTASDSTVNSLRDIGRGNKIERKAILESLKDQGYGDLSDDVKNSLAKEALAGGLTNGSRKVHLFGGLVAAAGYKLGGEPGAGVGYALGAATGAAVDKYGRAMGKKLMDGALLLDKIKNNPAAQRFGGLIKNAAARGNASLAATHFILQQTEPDYQKAMNGD